MNRDDMLRFKQIVIELHYPYVPENLALVRKLAETHLLVHLHPNNCCGTRNIGGIDVPNVFEATLIRKSDVTTGLKLSHDPVPSALDRINVPARPDIRLHGWPFTTCGDDNKLAGLPTVFYVTLEEDRERQRLIDEQFGKYSIRPTPFKSRRFRDSKDVITGKFIDEILRGVYSNHQVTGATLGCAVSHLKAIQAWHETTQEPYGFFCEDDLSLETVEHWGFTWREFVAALPGDWEAVQLVVVRDRFGEVGLRQRSWDDWAHTAYILKRSYAVRLLDTYVRSSSFHLEMRAPKLLPLGENIIFTEIGKVYSVPLFVENVALNSTFMEAQHIESGQKTNHRYSAEFVSSWWKANAASLSMLIPAK